MKRLFLYQEWLQQKLDEYVHAPRPPQLRGRVITMTPRQYGAALMQAYLGKASLAWIAEQTGVCLETLRRWRRQPEFLLLMDWSKSLFAASFHETLVLAAILAGLPARALWIWLVHFPDEHPLHTGLLYYLAAARGISMHGRRQASRYMCWGRDAKNAPRSSRLSYRFLARVFHVSRKAISEAMRWLWRQGWVVISKYGAWEPRYDVLRQRYALSSPKNRFKVHPSVLRDFGPTEAFVHGKVAKTDGMYRVTYRQTTRSLAESIGYAIRTMCRHATRLCAESLMCVFGRTRWGRYYSLSLSTLGSSEGEKVLPVREILRDLRLDLAGHESRGPPVESYGRLALEQVSKGQSVLEVTVKGKALDIKRYSQTIRDNKTKIDRLFAELETVTNEHDAKAKEFDLQLAELEETT